MTRLKALELVGFKSFADRTRFEFPEGITVVVGPNGSGKSNVVDAIKWVLGEQSVRNLRGKEMADVIFAGSVSRRPMNMAETSLIFDNSAGKLPLDSAEVSITRRVYRSGESEYLVNGETARLRDIRELFSGTGAATEAYSVIEQGRVDALLVASGKDRRGIFEEAAGITRFKVRRTEAMRRLEHTEQHRQRLADIVGEVAARLETVRNQASRARRWRDMQDRLRSLRLFTASRDVAGVDAELHDLTDSLESLRLTLDVSRSTAEQAASRIASLVADEHRLATSFETVHLSLLNCNQRTSAAVATLEQLRVRHAELTETIHRKGVQSLRISINEKESERLLLQSRSSLSMIERDGTALIEKLQILEDSVADSRQQTAQAHHRLEAAKSNIETSHEVFSRAQRDHERASILEEKAQDESTRLRLVAETIDGKLVGVMQAKAAAEGNVSALEIRYEASASSIETLEARENELAERLVKRTQDLTELKRELDSLLARKLLLEELEQRREGISNASRELLARNATLATMPCLLGLVADLLVADITIAPLVDLSLGESSSKLLVRSLDELFVWLESNEAASILTCGGAIGFIAVDRIPEPSHVDLSTFPGIVGRLDRLLSGNESTQRACQALLSNTWVVESLACIRHLPQEFRCGLTFVSTHGEIVRDNGILDVANHSNTSGQAAGLVTRISELRSLEARQLLLSERVSQGNDAVESIERTLRLTRDAIRIEAKRRQADAAELAASQTRLDRIETEERLLRDSFDVAGIHVAEALASTRLHAQRTQESASRLEESKHSHALANISLQQALSLIAMIERDGHNIVEDSNRLRINIATGQGQIAQARDLVTQRESECLGIRQQAVCIQQEVKLTEASLEKCELEMLLLGALIAEVILLRDTATQERNSLGSERSSVVLEKEQLTTQRDAERSRVESIAADIHRVDLKCGEVQHRRTSIVERIQEDYHVNMNDLDQTLELGALAEDPDLADRDRVDTTIEELKRKLASIGSVNLDALAEAEALEERHAKLDAQFADLTGAKNAIEQLLEKLDTESRRLLGETIETVRVHFRELFERLFGGGQADIVLDPDLDLLETTVEIVARPPGKEPRSISLLSGGEKTMTCVALLLAVFKSRPSPFCVLDEVDAALDEANVDRFTAVLRDFLSATQFIIVTHSKKTMSSATTLYGVTMEESGVSKRVSVRFDQRTDSSHSKAA